MAAAAWLRRPGEKEAGHCGHYYTYSSYPRHHQEEEEEEEEEEGEEEREVESRHQPSHTPPEEGRWQ